MDRITTGERFSVMTNIPVPPNHDKQIAILEELLQDEVIQKADKTHQEAQDLLNFMIIERIHEE